MLRPTPRGRPVSGKTLQTMMGMLIQDLNLDNGVETVLKTLINPSETGESVLELDKKTSDGDTILHRLVRASVDSPGNMKYYMQIVDKIRSRSGQWWKEGVDNVQQIGTIDRQSNHSDTQNDSEEKLQYQAMIKLLKIENKQKSKNVWGLAIEKGAVQMINKLMSLDGITCTNDGIFDVSSLVDMEFDDHNICLRSLNCFCNIDIFEEKLQVLLQDSRDKKKFEELMEVKPIKKLTDVFCSITTKIYIVVVVLHIMYMSLFSYLGCELMDVRNIKPTDTTKGLMYSFGLVEPLLLSFYLFNRLIQLFCLKLIMCSEVEKDEFRKIDFVWETLWFSTIFVYDVLLCLVIASVGSEITPTTRNVLSVCLLLGWLLTFALANGIKQIHFFFKLILRVIFTDVIKILLVYIIFLLGFSFSIHAQFNSSANITMTYKTPVHTMFLMFNVMVGMEEAVDESTEIYLEAVSATPLFSKLLYIGYVLSSTIVLLNLLIAMMNASYSTIEIEHLNEWVFNAVYFGTKTTIYFPALAKLLGARLLKKKKLFKYSIEAIWTIELSNTDMQLDDAREVSKYNDKDFRGLQYDIEHSEKILKAEIQKVKRSLNELTTLLERMQETPAKIQEPPEPNDRHRWAVPRSGSSSLTEF